MVIGITGTNGAGKGAVVDYLVQKKGFKHYSARAFLVEEIERRGLPINRDSTNLVGNDLRLKHGPAYVIEQLYERAKASGEDAVLESVRAVGEAKYLKSKGAILLFVDADPKIRYDRVESRATDLDKVDFDTFKKEEDREMDSTEPWNMNIRGVANMADYSLINEGTLEDLYVQIEKLPI